MGEGCVCGGGHGTKGLTTPPAGVQTRTMGID